MVGGEGLEDRVGEEENMSLYLWTFADRSTDLTFTDGMQGQSKGEQ